ncbi:EscU/YscU/HrcU family type III secretion system export apparatus switch protein [Paenalcaligenes sp. Me131]|uniref:EscU/YscU/HrcU family type III secretion system export apparatus switch protein n=1 Tax=Paenalcaligenes sp. Me131 TaxID=3392636 RepID=UPI003D27E087
MTDKIFSPPLRPSAVALRYDAHDPAPKVVAKGYGNIAETIIQTAEANGLHIHESRELVSLLMQVDLDAHIPPQLYQVVAELLAWVYSIENLDIQPLTPSDKNHKA